MNTANGDYKIMCEKRGESAVMRMSEKAQHGYVDAGYGVLTVWEYTKDDETLYAFESGSDHGEEMTFEELQEFLELMSPEELLADSLRAGGCIGGEEEDLCQLAGMQDEWEDAEEAEDEERQKAILAKAAEKLRVSLT